MANFTAQDLKMFSKWYGRPNLELIDEFWQDVFTVYHEQIVPMPLGLNDKTYQIVAPLLHCPPGECGDCCRYKWVALKPEDIERLLTAPGITREYLDSVCGDNEGAVCIKGVCPFLKDNKCSVYEYRPSICRTFPIQPGVMNRDEAGKPTEQMHIRMKCPASLNLARQIILQTLAHNEGLVLLPDLTVIRRKKNGD